MEEPEVKDKGFAWSWRPQRRRKGMEDELFDEGDDIIGYAVKQTGPIPENDDDDGQGSQKEHFCCQIAKCGKTFTSVTDYEMHYSNAHRNVCSECRRHFANGHLLDIHILETHNPMFATLAEKRPMYGCLVESCPEKFVSVTERRHHLVDVHKYPPNFRFNQTKAPKKKIAQKKDKVTNTVKSDNITSSDITSSDVTSGDVMSGDVMSVAMETESVAERLNPETETPIDEQQKQSSVSASGRRFIYNVPKTICFGQGSQRGFARGRGGRGRGRGRGRGKHWHQTEKVEKSKVDIEEVNMKDLSEALDIT